MISSFILPEVSTQNVIPNVSSIMALFYIPFRITCICIVCRSLAFPVSLSTLAFIGPFMPFEVIYSKIHELHHSELFSVVKVRFHMAHYGTSLPASLFDLPCTLNYLEF